MRQVTKRLFSMMLSVALAGGAIFIYFSYTSETYSNVQKTKSEAIGKENFFADNKDILQKVLKLVDAYQSQPGFQDRLAATLPQTPDVAGAIVQLNGLAQNNRVGITNFTASAPGVDRTEKSSKKKVGRDALIQPMGKINITVQFKSSYSALKEFMRGLETNLRIFNVESLSLKPAAKPNEDIYDISINVATYYQIPASL